MASTFSTQAIQSAIARVEAAFPFADYIRAGERTAYTHVASQIGKYVTGDDKQLLDIGSGPMDKTAVFAELGFACSAVDDLSDPWHRRGDNMGQILDFGKRMNINFHLQAANDYSIPFPTHHYDVATICAVIEHLHESPKGILNTAGMYLKTGGILCVTMPNSVNLRKRISVLRGRTNYPPVDQFFLSNGMWRGHVREYTLAETVYIVESAGFDILEASTYEEFAYDKLKGLALRLYLMVAKVFPGIRSGLCVIARRPANWQPFSNTSEAYRSAVATSIPDGIR